MRYRLSRCIPVRFATLYGVQITRSESEEGGHGNHFQAGEHFDAERVSYWQWRDRIFRQRTQRICLPA